MDLTIIATVLADLASVAVAATTAAVIAAIGFPVPDPGKRIGCVDGLRGYLALGVFVSHMHRWNLVEYRGGDWVDSTAPLPDLGGAAVALFFMATGLVFYPRIRAGLAGNNWAVVYVTRFFRLMPLVALSVAAVVGVISIRQQALPGSDDIRPIIAWLSTISEPPLMGYEHSWRVNAGVFWTLELEWMFYLAMLPACALAVTMIERLRVPAWAVPATILLASLAVLEFGDALPTETKRGFAYASLFAAGMLAFELQMRPAVARWLSRPCITLPAVIALVSGLFLWGEWEDANALSIMLFLAFFACVACGNSLWGMLNRRSALVLGECSYGIYIFHAIVMFAAFDLMRETLAPLAPTTLPIMGIPLAAVVVLMTATTYLLVEKPCIGMGKALAAQVKGRTPRFRKGELETAP